MPLVAGLVIVSKLNFTFLLSHSNSTLKVYTADDLRMTGEPAYKLLHVCVSFGVVCVRRSKVRGSGIDFSGEV